MHTQHAIRLKAEHRISSGPSASSAPRRERREVEWAARGANSCRMPVKYAIDGHQLDEGAVANGGQVVESQRAADGRSTSQRDHHAIFSRGDVRYTESERRLEGGVLLYLRYEYVA